MPEENAVAETVEEVTEAATGTETVEDAEAEATESTEA
jgi:hypothetical protein